MPESEVAEVLSESAGFGGDAIDMMINVAAELEECSLGSRNGSMYRLVIESERGQWHVYENDELIGAGFTRPVTLADSTDAPCCSYAGMAHNHHHVTPDGPPVSLADSTATPPADHPLVGVLVICDYDDADCPTVGTVLAKIDDNWLQVMWDGASEPSVEASDGLMRWRQQPASLADSTAVAIEQILGT